MISHCDCKHEYQDLKYGRGNRVFNSTKEPDRYVCTVCTKSKSVAKAEVRVQTTKVVVESATTAAGLNRKK